VFGGRANVPFGGVGDDDAAVRRGVDVDVVDADAGSADDREFVGGCEDFLGDLGARADDQSVRVRNRLEEVVALEFVARFDVVAGVSEYVQTRVCDRIRDENLHARDNRVENVNPSVVARAAKTPPLPSEIGAMRPSTANSALVPTPFLVRLMSDRPLAAVRTIFPRT